MRSPPRRGDAEDRGLGETEAEQKAVHEGMRHYNGPGCGEKIGQEHGAPMEWLIWFGLLALAGGVTLVARAVRDRGVAHKLKAMGLNQVNPDSDDLMRELRAFSFLKMGDKQRFKKAYRGQAEGMDVALFDFEFCVADPEMVDREDLWKVQTVAGFRCEAMELPKRNDRSATGYRVQAEGRCVILCTEELLIPAKDYERFVTRSLRTAAKLRADHPGKG